ncbi:MAG: Asp23/Gls24 family envelope stress response protein [Eubacterium sp.]|nr:Asp23/Gls24 family envelope stress response protein [Eubacterium sp.]MCR4839618.1 Asp23/Gls24 family envelope stress response protein [Eubacterium sp.]
MTGMMDNEHGQIMIDTSVIEEYAGHAALDCFGIVGMAAISMRDGLAKLLKGSSVSKGVTVDMDEEQRLTIDFHIIVAYGVSIRTVVSNLINTVKYQVEDYTSMKVKAINVYVEGVREID